MQITIKKYNLSNLPLRKWQKSVRHKATEGSSIEFIRHRMLMHEQNGWKWACFKITINTVTLYLQNFYQQHKNVIIIIILSSKIVYQSNLPIWHCIWNFYLFILLVGLQCIEKQHWMKNIWPVKQINHQFFSFWRNKNMKT